MPVERTFYHSGKLMFEGNFNEDGKKHGLCMLYKEDGSVLYEEHYHSGILMKKRYPQGIASSCQILKVSPKREKKIKKMFGIPYTEEEKNISSDDEEEDPALKKKRNVAYTSKIVSTHEKI